MISLIKRNLRDTIHYMQIAFVRLSERGTSLELLQFHTDNVVASSEAFYTEIKKKNNKRRLWCCYWYSCCCCKCSSSNNTTLIKQKKPQIVYL